MIPDDKLTTNNSKTIKNESKFFIYMTQTNTYPKHRYKIYNTEYPQKLNCIETNECDTKLSMQNHSRMIKLTKKEEYKRKEEEEEKEEKKKPSLE